MFLFLKSTSDDGDNKMPQHEKLVLIFEQRGRRQRTIRTGRGRSGIRRSFRPGASATE
jgi:hypothetical protein